MNMGTFPVLVLFFCCAFGYPQNGIQIFYRKTTTPDPVIDFFSTNCDLRTAECVERGQCETEIIVNKNCQKGTQVCCSNQPTERNINDGIIFPDNTSPHPPIKATRKQTKPTTTITTTTTTSTTTTTTTTTEEPIDEDWITPECGTQQSNGIDTMDIRDSLKGEFPWNVQIYSKTKNEFGVDQTIFLCGGTVIDNFVVLTSANCDIKKTSNLFVDAGVWNLEDINEKRQMRKVLKVIKHPKFQQTSRVSSLALLILDDQVDFSRNVNRVCLPESDTDLTESTCYLTGWGSSGENPNETIRSKMKVVDIKLLNAKQCTDKMRSTLPTYRLPESFVCALEESNNHVCPYDVGSPLICTIPGRDNQFYQVGIFAWNSYVSDSGNTYCTNIKGVANLFTNLKIFRNWIDTEMEKLERNKDIYMPQLNDEDNEAEV